MRKKFEVSIANPFDGPNVLLSVIIGKPTRSRCSHQERMNVAVFLINVQIKTDLFFNHFIFSLKKVFNFINTIKSKSANIILKLVNFKGDYDLDVTADPPKTNPAAA